MTKVLIAADDSETSVNAARAAHELFGDGADYLLISVGDRQPAAGTVAEGWGAPTPITPPLMSYPPLVTQAAPAPDNGASTGAASAAEHLAADVAAAASIATAEPIGAVGDPATAILDAAYEHEVDVVVVGARDRNWFARHFHGSVMDEVVRKSRLPVLVVK